VYFFHGCGGPIVIVLQGFMELATRMHHAVDQHLDLIARRFVQLQLPTYRTLQAVFSIRDEKNKKNSL
jgi:hypothetical protein